MLVLTRKIDEQIVIGDNIKITLVRVRGNSVRIGIEAPREVRVVRAELDRIESTADSVEVDDLGQVFAHPESNRTQGRSKQAVANRMASKVANASDDRSVKRELFVGKVCRTGNEVNLRRAPLANFVSAS